MLCEVVVARLCRSECFVGEELGKGVDELLSDGGSLAEGERDVDRGDLTSSELVDETFGRRLGNLDLFGGQDAAGSRDVHDIEHIIARWRREAPLWLDLAVAVRLLALGNLCVGRHGVRGRVNGEQVTLDKVRPRRIQSCRGDDDAPIRALAVTQVYAFSRYQSSGRCPSPHHAADPRLKLPSARRHALFCLPRLPASRSSTPRGAYLLSLVLYCSSHALDRLASSSQPCHALQTVRRDPTSHPCGD
jgi:hypothetical protein